MLSAFESQVGLCVKLLLTALCGQSVADCVNLHLTYCNVTG